MTPDDIEDDSADLSALLGENLPALPDLQHAVAPSSESQAAEAEWLAAYGELTPRHALFVNSYLTGKDGTTAAKLAGYPATSAHATAHKLLTERKGVMRAIAAWRERTRLAGEYTIEQAMSDAERVGALAIENRQFNAAVRAVEVKARLHGLLIDKSQVTVDTGPNVSHAMLLVAQRRAERARPAIVDAEYTEVGSD